MRNPKLEIPTKESVNSFTLRSAMNFKMHCSEILRYSTDDLNHSVGTTKESCLLSREIAIPTLCLP